MLDMKKCTGMTTEEFDTQWFIRDDIKPVELGFMNRQSAPLPDGKTLLMVGGVSSFTAESFTFNGESTVWEEYPGYKDPPFGYRAM